jgi:radical SAM superfamily enzyme YgiQ (UPF0313 family)
MRIYLADLFHTYNAGLDPDKNPYTVPLAVGYLAASVRHRIRHCEIKLFRNPNKLMQAIRSSPPDIMGFSICSWNTDLTRRASEFVKARSASTVTVAGGPSVDESDDQLIELFKLFPAIDYLVPSEGETGFASLCEAIAEGKRPEGQALAGVAYLDSSGRLVRGRYVRPVVPSEQPGFERISPKKVRAIGGDEVEVLSPYLDGTLNEFLDEGLIPIVQTMRGCPYQCSFCVSGENEWNRLRGFDLERVKAEIDYALSRSGSTDLILTDENWGILGQRDVELAKFILNRFMTKGSPRRLYYYTAKIVTPESRQIVEMVAPIAWIGEFSMSFQSLNPATRAAIKRTNIGMDKLASNIQWARERNVLTSSEMIYGMPHETIESFMGGVESLLQFGMNYVLIFPLQLFPGAELNSRASREKYGLQTRFRLADSGGFGIYDDGNLVSAETEEIVIATNTASADDYFTIRRYAFFQQVLLGRYYFIELFQLCGAVGISIEPLMRHLATADYTPYPALCELMVHYNREALAELRHSREEVYAEAVDRLRAGEAIAGVKLNLVYLAKLFSSPDAIEDLLAVIRGYCRNRVDGAHRELVFHYLDEVQPNRIVALQQDAQEQIRFSTRYNYPKWANRSFRNVDELLLAEPVELVATIHRELQKSLAKFDPTDRFALQGIIDRTHPKFLLRTVTA